MDRSARKKGIYLSNLKATAGMSVMQITLPSEVRIPMTHGRADAAVPVVSPGEKVAVGQLIARAEGPLGVPVHSSVSGTVTGIQSLPSKLGKDDLHVIVETDGRQTPADIRPPVISGREDLIRAARDCGLVGLGGAGYPTFAKLENEGNAFEHLIINGVECEPFVTSDHINTIAYAKDVAAGAALLLRWLDIKDCFIAVQRGMEEAFPLLEESCKDLESIKPVQVSRIFPAGEETALAETLLGVRTAPGELLKDKGVLVLNVSTLIKLQQYVVTGMPLVSRTVTVDGDAVSRPMNVEVPVGTPVMDVLQFCGADMESLRKIIVGGPMTGIALPDTNFYVSKTDDAFICFSAYRAERDRETGCINCGRCIAACPQGLMPNLLFKAWRKRDEEALEKGYLSACTGCGCCSFVCPARKQISYELGLARAMFSEPGRAAMIEDAEGGRDER
ncbi:MAG: RnfABCDGE type electron transport complex subunit C [Firmicutes bacterium]|nr:RnfABCDGE type electron transport complex subunit C [Bacillota bacterium]